MTGVERREKLLSMLAKSKEPIAGAEMAKRLSVSRQVIVQDIALLRAADNNIVSTNRGYVLLKPGKCERIFKVRHTAEEIEKELQIIVDNGGRILDVFVYHKIYGVVKAPMNIKTRKDIYEYVKTLSSGKSSPLLKITDNTIIIRCRPIQKISWIIFRRIWRNVVFLRNCWISNRLIFGKKMNNTGWQVVYNGLPAILCYKMTRGRN